MKTSRNTKGGGRPGGSNHGNGRDQHNTKGKFFYPKYLQEKLAITVLVITLALFALVMVLYRIVKDNNEQYNKIVLTQRQQEYESRTIPYRRGDIVDRNGTYLATSEKVYNLIIDPKQIMSDSKNYLEPTIEALTKSFGFDGAEIRSMIEAKPESAYLRYSKGRQLSYDQKTAFEQLEKEMNQAYSKSKDDVEGKKRVRGIWFEDEYKRIYPYNSLACNVIGFTSSDGSVGNGGIEQYYNSSLTGVNGREYGYLDEDSNLQGVVKQPEGGKTVVSTIDVNIQNIVQKYINEWQTSVGSKVTAVIVMNPNNGEILAMGTSNVFDLNNPRDVSGYTQDELMALGKKEAVAVYKRQNDGNTITEDQVLNHFSQDEVLSYGQQVAWNQIWRNYCVSDTYEPGSPSKIFTVAAALEEGVIKPEDKFECTGFLHVGDYNIKCTAWRRGGHGWLDVKEAIMQSCNVAMMKIGALIGRDRFTKYQSMFGFGDKTGIDLPGEADTKDLVYHADNMRPTDLATNAFGQNYNCTMVQLSAAFCSVINGGSYYEPHVVKEILNEQGSVVKKKDPVLVRETVSQSTADFLKDAMYGTVEAGTGKAAKVVGYAVGGKTGTAEKQPRSAKNYLVSFTGFAPIEDPQVFVYVLIDTPNFPPGDEQAHSSFASAMFSKIMTEILPYMNIFPTQDQPEDEAVQESLPAEEGINQAPTESQEDASGETQKVYDTEEVAPDDGGSGIPDAVPQDPSASQDPLAPQNQTDSQGSQDRPSGAAPDSQGQASGGVTDSQSQPSAQEPPVSQNQPDASGQAAQSGSETAESTTGQ